MKSTYMVILSVVFSSSFTFAQPSGGPYGPVRKIYELPEDAHKIYVAPDGKSSNSGETLDKPATIESALERAVTGDAIIMRGGIYRTGNLEFNQAITIQPYKDEQPILKGTMVAADWQRQRNGLWKTSWPYLFPEKPANWWRRQSHGRTTPLHRFNNDMVFVDGRYLQSTSWEGQVDETTFFIDYDNNDVYISIDPNDKLIEITAFASAVTVTNTDCHGKTPSGKGPIIRGITFTQYAYLAFDIKGKDPQGPSNEANHGNDIVGTVLENCTISYCGRVAGYFKGDKLRIRHCLISDTSTEGLYIIASDDVLLEKNIFTRNNIENIQGYFPAAVKIFNQCHRATCRDNLIVDNPNSNGIWYDVGNVDGIIIDNWFQGVGDMSQLYSDLRYWKRHSGFFIEISKGALCAGNIFINCDQGIFVLNSSDVKMYQNTFVNSTVNIMRTERVAAGDTFGWHADTGPDLDKRIDHVFVNNLLTSTNDFPRPLLALSQTLPMCRRFSDQQVKQVDYNVYVRSANFSDPLILWSPAPGESCHKTFETLEDFRNLCPQFEANSRYFPSYDGPLFKSAKLGNYELLRAFPASDNATQLPLKIKKLLNLKTDENFPGAYPPIK